MKNICFAGGGMKGITYIGVYKYLIELDLIKDLENLGGSSIGALMSLCIILEYTVSEMEILLKRLKYSLLEDIDLTSFLSRYSINSGKKLKYFLKKLITSKGFKPDVTFGELYNHTRKGLFVCTTKLDDYSTKIFSHIDSPDTQVYLACMYSISLPFLWSSDGYVDGCLSCNLPITHFPVEDTVGVICENIKTQTCISDINEYTSKVLKCCLYRANYYEIESYILKGYKIATIRIPPIGNLDFEMSDSNKENLVNIGYNQFREFLGN